MEKTLRVINEEDGMAIQNQAMLDGLLKPKYMTVNILWFALTMSMLMYLFIGYTISVNGEPVPADDQTLILAFYAVAGVTMIVSLAMRFFLFSDERIERELSKPLDLDALAVLRPRMPADAATLEKLKQLTEKEQRLFGLPGAFMAPLIFNLAMNESVVIYGLILTLMYHRFSLMMPFAVAGLLLNLTHLRTVPALVERGARALR